jgi:hypothetical protein
MPSGTPASSHTMSARVLAMMALISTCSAWARRSCRGSRGANAASLKDPNANGDGPATANGNYDDGYARDGGLRRAVLFGMNEDTSEVALKGASR